MKTMLIAAGLMAAMLGTAPASATPLGGTAPGAAQQRGGQDTMSRGNRDQGREDADRSTNRTDRNGADWNRSERSGADWNRSDRSRSEWNRSDRRGREWNRSDRRGRDWNNGWRGNHYGWNNRRCHNERRHHRWVRVCGRNWR